jgi:hypothetical protein
LQRVEIRPERNWHGESPRSPYRIKFAASRESPAESSSQGIGTTSHYLEPVGPIADAYGHDFPGHVDELIPSKAAGVQDGLIRFENSIGDPVVADELPDVFHRIEFRALGGQRNECDVFRHDKLGG